MIKKIYYLLLVYLFVPFLTRAEEVRLKNPLGSVETIPGVINLLVNGVLGIIGAIFLIMFFWGGAKLIFSFGNQEKVKSGASTMLWAVVGLFVVFGSYMLIKILFSVLFSG